MISKVRKYAEFLISSLYSIFGYLTKNLKHFTTKNNLATVDCFTIFVYNFLHSDAAKLFWVFFYLSKCLLLYEQALCLILLWLNEI